MGVVDSDVQLFATFASSDLYISETLASFYVGEFHRCSVQRFCLVFAPSEFLSLLDTPGEGCEAFSSGGEGLFGSPESPCARGTKWEKWVIYVVVWIMYTLVPPSHLRDSCIIRGCSVFWEDTGLHGQGHKKWEWESYPQPKFRAQDLKSTNQLPRKS